MHNNFPSHRKEASRMSFSQETWEWHVNCICYSLTDSLQIMQQCCHCGVILPSAVHIVINDIHYSWYQRTLSSKTQQSIVNMRSGGISASLPQVLWVSKSRPSQREWSQPKNDITEGIIMFTDDMPAESILLTGVSWVCIATSNSYSIQVDWWSCTLAWYLLVADWINDEIQISFRVRH